MVGHPLPARRAASRMTTAPPPYIGAMTSPIGSASIETFPSKNSPTNGERKKRPSAGAIRRSMVGSLIRHDRYSAPAREYSERSSAGRSSSGSAMHPHPLLPTLPPGLSSRIVYGNSLEDPFITIDETDD